MWTCHKGTLNWFMQSTGQSNPTKSSLNCFARKLDSGTSTRAFREKEKTVMIVLVLLFSFCFLSDHLLCLVASGREASQVATESEENRRQEDVGEEGGALTDAEEEAQDANPQDIGNPRFGEKEEQQEDSTDAVTKTFGMMTTGSTAPATKMHSPLILHFHTLHITMKPKIIRWSKLIFLC